MDLILRDYQFDIIKKTRECMSLGKRRPLVCLPTGSGKTAVFAWLANKAQIKGKVVWFLVHRRELLDQTIDTFEKFSIPMDSVYVGMVISVANKPEKFPAPDMIIFDEAHHSSAATWGRIIEKFPNAFLIGLTATPCRSDGKPLGEVYDELIVGVSPSFLIDEGFLAPYRYFAPSVADLSGLRKKGKDYDTEQAAGILSQRAVFGDVIKHWFSYASGYQTIVYCSSIVHSEATAAAFVDAGVTAVHFDGTTPKEERKKIIADFRSGKIKILCNVDLIGEGFDVPDCWCCVLLRPTMSLGLFIQQAGRSLRPQPGKVAIILDHVGNYSRHGLPDDSRAWSLEETVAPPDRFDSEGNLKVKQCLECFGTFAAGPSVCPYCGAVIQKTREEIRQIESIHLQEIKKAEQARIDRYKNSAADRVKELPLDSCKNLTEVMAWCKINGKKSGFGYIYAKKRGFVK